MNIALNIYFYIAGVLVGFALWRMCKSAFSKSHSKKLVYNDFQQTYNTENTLIELTFNDTPYSQITTTIFMFENQGNSQISEIDVNEDTPLHFKLSDDDTILSAHVCDYKDDTKVDVSICDNENIIFLNITNLSCNHSFTIKILSIGSGAYFKGKLKDCTIITDEDNDKIKIIGLITKIRTQIILVFSFFLFALISNSSIKNVLLLISFLYSCGLCLLILIHMFKYIKIRK